ncbi:MAG: hypothetical protein U0798_09675 [Gemmataceae bacterium]
MTNTVAALPTLEALSSFVRKALCDRDLLDPEQTPFFRTPVIRNGRPWGYLFHVEGPRLLKSSALWAAEAETVVFYDTNGQKVQEVQLTDAPVLPDIRAHDAGDVVTKPRRKSA